MRTLRHIVFLLAVLFSTTSCSSTMGNLVGGVVDKAGNFFDRVGNSRKSEESPQIAAKGPTKTVRTTAYSHQEAEAIPYGRKNAIGTNLKYGQVRSAAADWSVYPVGTVFKIEGEPYLYEVDDYGSALVGTQTIDLYKPTISAMNHWGVRHVDIRILRWGSFQKSLAILEPRASKASHVRKMASSIRSKS